MTARAERIVDSLVGLDPLADLPRTGWLLRGDDHVNDHDAAAVGQRVMRERRVVVVIVIVDVDLNGDDRPSRSRRA